MAVYVDNYEAPYRGMRMNHLIADTTEELLAMVDAIGVQRKWIQKAGTYKEHFDICNTKKAKALALGAIAIDARGYVRIINQRKNDVIQETPSAE